MAVVDRIERTVGEFPIRVLLQRGENLAVEDPAKAQAIETSVLRHLTHQESDRFRHRLVELVEGRRPMLGPLENVERLHLVCNCWNQLHGAGTVADDNEPVARQVWLVMPM